MPLALTLMLLTIWAGAIFTFVNFDFSDERLWVPVLLALVGVFGSILPLVVAPVIALVANAATMLLFVASLETLRPNHRRAVTYAHHRRL